MKKLAATLAGGLLAGSAFAGGTIEGMVDFTGTAPKPAKLNRKADPVCAKKEFNDESVMVSSGKGLENVVLRLKEAPKADKVPSEPVLVDQKDCMYRPRVQAAVEGQEVMIRNSDGTLHNVHSYAGTKTLFNQAQPPKSTPLKKNVPANTEVVKMKCDVHPWMTGYVVYSKSPYFAVSDKDGKFTIKDVPPGTYTLEAWHEKLGTQTTKVTVQDGQTAEAKLAFK